MEGSPGCNTRQGPTADFPPGEIAGRGLDTLGSGVSSPRTPPSSSPVSGWVAPTGRAWRKAQLAAGSRRVLLLRMAQSPPLETHYKDASPSPRSPLLWSHPGAKDPEKPRKRDSCSRVCRWAGPAGKLSQAEIKGPPPHTHPHTHPPPRGRWLRAPVPWWRGPQRRWSSPPTIRAPPPPQSLRRWARARARPASRSPPPAAPGSSVRWSSRRPWLVCGSPAPSSRVTPSPKSRDGEKSQEPCAREVSGAPSSPVVLLRTRPDSE